MAYKVFANGNPLPASDLNTYLMNQAVISFANSTARSTAIPSPVEGMLTYLEDTNAYEGWTGSAWVNINDNSNAILKSVVTTTGDLIVANGNASVTRLGIGANGTYLTSNGTTASWGTVSSGGETLISTTTLTGATTTLSSIPGTYKDLKLVIRKYKPASDGSIYLRFNSDDGNSFKYLVFVAFGVNTWSGSGNNYYQASAPNDSAYDNGSTVIWLYDYANDSTWKMIESMSVGDDISNPTTAVRNRWISGMWKDTAAISSISLFNDSGQNFTSGTALLYGVS